MRHTCERIISWIEEEDGSTELCGQPAVDYYVQRSGETKWYCAEHWDAIQIIRAIFERLKKNRAADKNS